MLRSSALFLVCILLSFAACGNNDTDEPPEENRAPAPPAGVTAQPGDQEVSLEWNTVAGADSYAVHRSLDSGGPYDRVASVNTPAFVDTGVTNDVTYFYVVTAINEHGSSGFSEEVSATPQAPGDVAPSPPGRPDLLTATAGDAQVVLTWDRVPGATYYRVFVSQVSGGPYEEVVQVPGTGYTHTGLENGVTYYYRITSLNNAGSSGFSNEASATPTADAVMEPPPAPANPGALPGDQQVFLSWDPAPGATSYRVYARTQDSQRVQVGEVETTSFTHTGLTNGETYFYVVRGVNEAGVGDASEEVQATPRDAALEPPPAPDGLQAVQDEGSVTLQWNPVDDAQRYLVYRAAEGEAAERIGATRETFFDDDNVAPGVTYKYFIRAENEAGQGPPSDPATIAIPDDNGNDNDVDNDTGNHEMTSF